MLLDFAGCRSIIFPEELIIIQSYVLQQRTLWDAVRLSTLRKVSLVTRRWLNLYATGWKITGTLHPWVCAPDHRGPVLVLGRKRWLGGFKLRPWGWAGHERPRNFLMALWWVWAPTNWGDKPELQVCLWGGIYRSRGPYPKKAGEAPTGQESLSLADSVKYSRKDELWVIYFWLMLPGESIKIHFS